MGISTSIYINKKHIHSIKNYIDPFFIKTVFKKSDNRIIEKTSSDLIDFEIYDEEISEDNEFVYFFRSTVGEVRDRLNILGYSYKGMRENFTLFVKERVNDLSESLDSLLDAKPDYIKTFLIDCIEKEVDFWGRTTLDDFLIEIHSFFVNPPETTANNMTDNKELCHSINEYIMQNIDLEKPFFGYSSGHDFLTDRFVFLNYDSKQFDSVYQYLKSQGYIKISILPFEESIYALKAILNYLPGEWSVAQDYTEFVESGDIDESFPDNMVDEKTIILTEGSSDIDILEPSLNLLYPHLSDYFSFMDFKNFKAEGSAGALVNNIKSFAGSGAKNKIIAIFDNDTAAKEAQSALQNIKLPDNIKVLNYPDVAIAKNYPTLGPTGFSLMDVNGLACSIELYIGEDVLRDPNGELTPIQWKGYSAKMQAYQGEVLSKSILQEKFKAKLQRAQEQPALIENQDWDDIRLILNVIFEAFHK
jgi:hypothetical protein